MALERPRILLMPEGETDGTLVEHPPEKTFNQADVDRIVTDRVKKLDRENKQKDNRISELTEQFNQLQGQLTQLLQEKEAKNNPPSDDVQGQINILTERHRREAEQLAAKIEDLTTKLTDQTKRRLETERDKEVTEGLNNAGCTDLKMGKRWAAPQVVYDEVDGRWVFELEKGGVVTIAEGIAEELPDYLKKARSTGGGSGSTTGSALKTSQLQQKLQAETNKLQQLREAAERAPNSGALLVYQKQKRVVEALQREATKSVRS
jgi:hypothetical protein